MSDMKGELSHQLGPIVLIFLGTVLVPAARAADAERPAEATSAATAASESQSTSSATSSDDKFQAKDEEVDEDNGERRREAKSEVELVQSSIEEQDTAAQEIERAISVFQEETESRGLRSDSPEGARRRTGPAAAWHGRAYEYLRNNAFDAVPHEVTQGGGNQNILRRNQFGFSVSGPVLIPKLYDGRRSTFFTFSYEGTRESVGRSYLMTVPTGLQRSGDFSDLVNKAGAPLTVYDPRSTRLNQAFDPSQPVTSDNLQYAREPFANNRVPVTRLDPVAMRMAAEQPLPNANIGPFLQNNFWTNPAERSSPNGILAKVDHNLFERHKLTVDIASSNGFQGQPRLYSTIGNPGSPDRNFVDRRLQVRETYAVSPNAVYQGSVTASSESVDAMPPEAERNLPQELGLRGVTGSVFPTVRMGDFQGLGAAPGSYRRNVWNTYSTSHELTLRRGTHSWSLSSSITKYQLNTFEQESPSGYFEFDDRITGLPGVTNTGSSYASFLLGDSFRARVTDTLHPSYLRRTLARTLVRDEIEVNENLTLTLRVALDLETPRVEKYDRQSTIDLDAVNPANGLPGALVFANRDGYGRGFQPTRATVEPQIGFAWSPTAKRDTVLRGSFYHYYYGPSLHTGPFGTQGFSSFRNLISPNQQLEPAVTLADGPPESAYPLPDLRAVAANDTDANFIPQTGRMPRYNRVYMSFEQRLPLGMTVRAQGRSYRGANMFTGGSARPLNGIPVEALQYRDQLNNEAFRRTLRPYPQFQRIDFDGQFADGRYLYDSGEFSVEKRTGQGLSFDMGYQYRRQMDDYTGPNIQDPASLEWARTRGMRPHNLSLNYVYEIPLGEGKALLNQAGILTKVLGDWSLSGFTRWMSGDPIVLSPMFNNTGGVVTGLRVDAVPGVDPHLSAPGPRMWFNPAAFAHPDDFALGNVPRTHPSLNNPSWQNHDLAISKRLPLSSEKSLELLLQSFNFLNTANWNNPDAEIGTPSAPNVNAGRIIGSRGGRVLQLGMRYNF